MDWPFIYEWSIYSLKTSTIENLTRAILETGYGAFVWQEGKGSRKIQLNLEGGVVFDYSDMEAYSSNVSSGYLKMAIEFDFEWAPISGKSLLYYYSQIINPDPAVYADQTRWDMELMGAYHFNSNWYLSVGSIISDYIRLKKKFMQSKNPSALPEFSFIVYFAATYKHKFKYL